MTTLSAEVAEAVDGYDQTVTKQLLSTQQNYRWRNRAESEVVANMLADQLSVADKAIERLHARGRERETERHVILEDNTRLRAELEQARAECEAIKLRSGELCEKCGWRSKFVGNQCLCCMANAENFP